MAKSAKPKEVHIAPTPVFAIQLLQRLREFEKQEADMKKQQRELNKKVGKAMRECREASTMSLRELAGRIGCSSPFLCDMELGRRRYSLRWCRKVLFLLNGKDPEGNGGKAESPSGKAKSPSGNDISSCCCDYTNHCPVHGSSKTHDPDSYINQP